MTSNAETEVADGDKVGDGNHDKPLRSNGVTPNAQLKRQENNLIDD